MKKQKELYVVLKNRNITIKVKEKLPDGRYRLIDGDVVGEKEIEKTIKQ